MSHHGPYFHLPLVPPNPPPPPTTPPPLPLLPAMSIPSWFHHFQYSLWDLTYLLFLNMHYILLFCAHDLRRGRICINMPSRLDSILDNSISYSLWFHSGYARLALIFLATIRAFAQGSWPKTAPTPSIVATLVGTMYPKMNHWWMSDATWKLAISIPCS